MMKEIHWILKPFERLTAQELYSVLRLRNEVFIVEQDCAYLDADNLDQKAFHLLGWQDEKLVAYARMFAPGDYYEEAAIGRIVTASEVRGKGMGKALMEEGLKIANRMYGEAPIAMGAQCYLEKFYNAFGFQKTGDTYLEDGIPHAKMILRVNSEEKQR